MAKEQRFFGTSCELGPHASRPLLRALARPTGDPGRPKSGSQRTRPWREMDSNFQYASSVRWHQATDLPLPPTVKRRSAGRPPPMAPAEDRARPGYVAGRNRSALARSAPSPRRRRSASRAWDPDDSMVGTPAAVPAKVADPPPRRAERRRPWDDHSTSLPLMVARCFATPMSNILAGERRYLTPFADRQPLNDGLMRAEMLRDPVSRRLTGRSEPAGGSWIQTFGRSRGAALNVAAPGRIESHLLAVCPISSGSGRAGHAGTPNVPAPRLQN
jgi:hypothetical protein